VNREGIKEAFFTAISDKFFELTSGGVKLIDL
jgi:hypothetical protein